MTHALYYFLIAGILAMLACGGDDADQSGQTATGERSALLTEQLGATVREVCQRAGERVETTAVYCPPLVPRGRTVSQGTPSSHSFYNLNFVSESLAGFDPAQPRGVRRHLGHWLVQGGDPRRLNQALQTNLPPGLPDPARTVDLAGVEATLYQIGYSASIHSGHVVVVWRISGQAFAVSVHGFEHRELALEMAEALVEEMTSE